MCFSEKASMGAFLVGLISLGFILQKKMYVFGMFYASVFVMQLAEFFAHKSLNTHNMELNKLSALAILFVVFVQPVLWSLYNATYVIKDKQKSKTIYGVVVAFTLFSIFFYNYINEINGMKVTRLTSNCTPTFCRLNWSFFGKNVLLSLVWLFFYFFLFMYTNHASNRFISSSFNLLPTLLALSILYMIIVDKVSNIQEIVGGFGSIWCISAVSVGPLALLYPSISK